MDYKSLSQISVKDLLRAHSTKWPFSASAESAAGDEAMDLAEPVPEPLSEKKMTRFVSFLFLPR